MQIAVLLPAVLFCPEGDELIFREFSVHGRNYNSEFLFHIRQFLSQASIDSEIRGLVEAFLLGLRARRNSQSQADKHENGKTHVIAPKTSPVPQVSCCRDRECIDRQICYILAS